MDDVDDPREEGREGAREGRQQPWLSLMREASQAAAAISLSSASASACCCCRRWSSGGAGSSAARGTLTRRGAEVALEYCLSWGKGAASRDTKSVLHFPEPRLGERATGRLTDCRPACCPTTGGVRAPPFPFLRNSACCCCRLTLPNRFASHTQHLAGPPPPPPLLLSPRPGRPPPPPSCVELSLSSR